RPQGDGPDVDHLLHGQRPADRRVRCAASRQSPTCPHRRPGSRYPGSMTDDLASVVLEEARDKMTKAVVHTRQDFANVRTGRAAPALVEKLPVEYYGSDVPLQQL